MIGRHRCHHDEFDDAAGARADEEHVSPAGVHHVDGNGGELDVAKSEHGARLQRLLELKLAVLGHVLVVGVELRCAHLVIARGQRLHGPRAQRVALEQAVAHERLDAGQLVRAQRRVDHVVGSPQREYAVEDTALVAGHRRHGLARLLYLVVLDVYHLAGVGHVAADERLLEGEEATRRCVRRERGGRAAPVRLANLGDERDARRKVERIRLGQREVELVLVRERRAKVGICKHTIITAL